MLLLSNTTRSTIPAIPFSEIAKDIVGPKYELTLSFVGDKRSTALNIAHRGKSYTPNVLSFPLSPVMGEIYINPKEAKKQAPSFELSYRGMCGLLFIHALLHLKGYAHGDTMERVEARYMQKYGLH